MDRKGTNELISGEKSFIAILSNLRVYFVVRLPDYIARASPTNHIDLLRPVLRHSRNVNNIKLPFNYRQHQG